MIDIEQYELTVRDRLDYAKEQVFNIVKRVWLYILLGVGIGAVIHNWIPENVISAVLGQDKWYSVLVASLVGVPMYADIFGTLPVAEALVYKGWVLEPHFLHDGGDRTFLPSLIMLKTAVKIRLLAIFLRLSL